MLKVFGINVRFDSEEILKFFFFKGLNKAFSFNGWSKTAISILCSLAKIEENRQNEKSKKTTCDLDLIISDSKTHYLQKQALV